MQKLMARWLILSAIAALMALGGCGGHEAEDTAREELQQQEEMNKEHAAKWAAEDAELRRGERK